MRRIQQSYGIVNIQLLGTRHILILVPLVNIAVYKVDDGSSVKKKSQKAKIAAGGAWATFFGLVMTLFLWYIDESTFLNRVINETANETKAC